MAWSGVVGWRCSTLLSNQLVVLKLGHARGVWCTVWECGMVCCFNQQWREQTSGMAVSKHWCAGIEGNKWSNEAIIRPCVHGCWWVVALAVVVRGTTHTRGLLHAWKERAGHTCIGSGSGHHADARGALFSCERKAWLVGTGLHEWASQAWRLS